MNLDPATRTELERLLSICCDDEPTEAEQARLNELLRSDADCRRFYLRYMDLHARLLQRPGKSPPVMVSPTTALGSAVASKGFSLPTDGSVLRSYLWLLLATAIVLPAARFLWLQAKTSQPQTVAATPVTTRLDASAQALQTPGSVAVITEATGAVWSDLPTRDPGSRLKPGTFKLEAGLVKLQFDGGALVTLYGPARVRLINSRSVALSQGRALVCDNDSRGSFELLTPQARWVDEGAHYGAVVTPEAEELHVMAGEVLRTARYEFRNRAVPSVRLSPGGARRFAYPGTNDGIDISLDPEWQSFCKLTSRFSAQASLVENLIAYESFESKSQDQWPGEWNVQHSSSGSGEFRRTFGLRHAAMTEPGDARLLRGRVVASRPLPQPVRIGVDGVYYFSFLVRNSRASIAGEPCDVRFAFHSGRNVDLRHELSTTLSWSRNNLAVSWESGTRQTSVPLDVMRLYVVVGKLVLGSVASDQLFVRLYGGNQSLPSSEPLEWTVVGPAVKGLVDFDSVAWSSANTHGIAVDELRLGSSWAAVAGPYELPIVAATELGKQLPSTAK